MSVVSFISCDREIAYLEQLYDDLYRVRHEIGADVLYTLHQRIELLRGEQ